MMSSDIVSVMAAASGSTNSTQGMLIMVAEIVVIMGVFWFFAIRPQSKQRKEHESQLLTLEVGDSIVTTSGFYGVVIAMEEEVVVVEFGSNKNCRIPMKKENISQIEKQNK